MTFRKGTISQFAGELAYRAICEGFVSGHDFSRAAKLNKSLL